MVKTTYLYIFAVLPSSSGSAISGAVVGYVTGICTNKIFFFEYWYFFFQDFQEKNYDLFTGFQSEFFIS